MTPSDFAATSVCGAPFLWEGRRVEPNSRSRVLLRDRSSTRVWKDGEPVRG